MPECAQPGSGLPHPISPDAHCAHPWAPFARICLRSAILAALVSYAGSTVGVTPSLPHSGSPRRKPKGIRVVLCHRGILSARASGFLNGEPATGLGASRPGYLFTRKWQMSPSRIA
jgi:hypothetical protein